MCIPVFKGVLLKLSTHVVITRVVCIAVLFFSWEKIVKMAYRYCKKLYKNCNFDLFFMLWLASDFK